jgi:hypothetical protein
VRVTAEAVWVGEARMQATWTHDATWVHGGSRAARTRGAAALHRCEARERSGSCSPPLAREDEAESEAGSPEHEQRRRGGATAVEDGGGRLTSRGR